MIGKDTSIVRRIIATRQGECYSVATETRSVMRKKRSDFEEGEHYTHAKDTHMSVETYC